MKNPLCAYKDSLGRPNEGVHAQRIYGFAANDIIATVLFTALFSYMIQYNFFYVLLIICLIMIVLHRAFCVNTVLNVKIFGEVS
jgi:fatty-acid desaturase